ncbi:hypothetical protein [uncultured Pontibacter sp.]|uniref:hypothetical protein n=1 Tax=uncultured Pontibacter sp. TaxID=453356 RepID=UPI00262E8D42|nr:hypothetical protein [uncultured Pontibacter sp.]
MKKFIIWFVVTVCLTSCNIGAGTLGSFDDRKFRINFDEMQAAMNLLEEQKIPDKWKETAASIQHTYEFLSANTTCFYFQESPEEMYFISYQGNSKVTVMSVRSVFMNGRWFTERELTEAESERIENRFDKEIVGKLEKVTKSKATREN